MFSKSNINVESQANLDISNNNFDNNNVDKNCFKHAIDIRNKYPNNPFISFVNINSLRNKIDDLREIMEVFSPDYLVLAETKIDYEFPSAQFT